MLFQAEADMRIFVNKVVYNDHLQYDTLIGVKNIIHVITSSEMVLVQKIKQSVS